MKLEDMILVSVDDHVVEPRDMFERHAPAKFGDRLPRLITNERGIERWVWEGDETGSGGLNAVVTWPKEQWGTDPVSHAEMRPGCYDIHQRIVDMNVNGVAASLNFPTYARFSGAFFASAADKELAAAGVRAYNDWHIDEWCAAYPSRLMPLAIPMSWDVDLTADEVRRIAAKGCHAICFTENPADMGLPSLHTGYWDPFFAACSDTGTVVCIHIGSSGLLPTTSDDAPIDIPVTLATMQTMRPMMDFLFSDVLWNFPDLRIALSEGGAGWLPYTLDRLDRHVRNHQWTGHRYTDVLPSEMFRKHFLSCVISDPAGLSMRDRIGIDTIAIETDYPHSDSQWPSAPETFWSDFQAAQMTDDEIDKVTHENALRFFGFDLFSKLPRAAATVGALRALSPGVDTATTTKEQYKARYEELARQSR
jgi:predicted TIM-barrel fold metal-dependent hydrolase